jgi:arylformamidase
MYGHPTLPFLSLLLTLFLVPTLGQDKSTYYTVRNASRFTIDWSGFYERADKLTEVARRDFPNHLDIPYGMHPKQKLDLYLPAGNLNKAPVFLFIHGGGFREGDRTHYGFIAPPLAKRGIITVLPSYRLTSQGFHYPSQPKDIRSAIAWVYQNIERFGGDPKRIIVGGHSAGGILAADVSVNRSWLSELALPLDLISGTVMISTSIVVDDPKAALGGGGYNVRKAEGNAYVDDPTLREKANPLLNIHRPVREVLMVVGKGEDPYLQAGKVFVNKLQEQGTKVEWRVFSELNHAQTALVLGQEESALFQALLQLINGH